MIDLVEECSRPAAATGTRCPWTAARRVRQGDGVHLNTTGASVAANVVIRTLRRERILR